MLTNQTRVALIQLLQAVSPETVRLLVIKHLDFDPPRITTDVLLEALGSAGDEALTGLLVEVVGGTTAIRADAPRKGVFDARHADLRGRPRADGFEVVEDSLTQLIPVAQPAAQVVDQLEQALSTGDLDTDGEVRRLLAESHSDFSATPPDFNGGTTKARIALEIVARRSAALLAKKRGKSAPADTWGAALAFLRAEGVIALQEEQTVASVYTLISNGAHVPRGLTDQQWALLARMFAVAATYFITRQHLAA
jgi:hypothetical protein